MKVDNRCTVVQFFIKAFFAERNSAVVSESSRYLQRETIKVFNKKRFS